MTRPTPTHRSPFEPPLPKDAKTPVKPTDPNKGDADHRIAPDPFALVLPALAALGAISSVAAINWVAHEKTPDRAKARRKAGMALRDLENCCIGLSEIFKKFIRHPKLFAGDGAQAGAPMKFGVHGARVDTSEARLYQQLMSDVASMIVLASQSAFDLMAAIEDGEIDAPEQLFYGFGEEQDRLNKLISGRATLKTCVDTGYEVSERLTRLVRELKKHKIEG